MAPAPHAGKLARASNVLMPACLPANPLSPLRAPPLLRAPVQVQVIAFLCHLRDKGIKGPFLILGPLSTLPNWVSEFERWAPHFPVRRGGEGGGAATSPGGCWGSRQCPRAAQRNRAPPHAHSRHTLL